jgi:hypothetical protein
MKVVFADFDGVIFTFGNYDFSLVACNNFSWLLDKVPDVKIVISSSWRHLGIDQCKKTLDANGIDSKRVIDITGNEPGERGNQVKAWLNTHPDVTNYVIIDDNTDFTGLMDHLVKTNPHIGFTEKDIEIALDILKLPR